MRAFLAASILPLVLVTTSAPSIDGAFALQHGDAKANGYLRAAGATSDPLEQHLDLWMTRKNDAQPIRRYAVDMTKLLHLVVISDDFTQFMHIHPSLGADGHFTIEQRFPKDATYHVYADAEPAGIGRQVFRFDLPLGTDTSRRDLAATNPRVAAGPYTVALSSTAITAGRDTTLTVHITHGGKPASDLHPYLGALAHVVLIDARDLSYAHVHPEPLATGGAAMAGMDMPGMEMPALSANATSSPDMAVHLAVHEAGLYKMWFQFRGGRSLYVAPFVLKAS